MTQVNERREPLTANEREWLRVRAHLKEHRYELSLKASEELYPDVLRVAGTPLLSSEAWVPAAPVPLDRIALDLEAPTYTAWMPTGDVSSTERYSEVVRRLAAPAVFENRTTYRLLAADLHGPSPRMSFGVGRYFDGMDTGEAVGHEYAAQELAISGNASLRAAIGDPVDPARRPTNVAISALTIRHDRVSGDARFLLHWRDPAKVGHAGGLFQVIPVGIFQPATEHAESLQNDFSLWRSLVREYAEELLGEDEAAADAGPIDYEHWPVAAELTSELRRGSVRAFCLGMGVDPLTLATDLLCAVVIDAEVFDRALGALVHTNTEGSLAGHTDGQPGVRLIDEEVERLTTRERMQAAGAATLALAWQHRTSLLV